MTLQTSGPISLEDIRAEFLGSTPISLNQYYRGGGLVPNVAVNASIPTSGTISISNFYGTKRQNLIPAPVDWNNINGGEAISGFYSENTNIQKISTTTENITLRATITGVTFVVTPVNVGTTLTETITLYVDNGGTITSNGVSYNKSNNSNSFITISVPPEANVYFNSQLSYTSGGAPGGAVWNGTATISNESSSNTVLDTFTINMQARTDGNLE